MSKVDHHSSDVKIDPVLEKLWQRAKRFERYDYYGKSAYPPMQIEPLPDERSRLAGEGMTAEQRALRKQWMHDQILHHDRRFVPESKPYNIFRKIYRWPADTLLYKPFNAMFGHHTGDVVRYCIPKAIIFFLGSYLVWYHIKYHANDWTKHGGVRVYNGKPILFGNENYVPPEKDQTDYYDHGFKSRKALLFKE